ncbi:MAG: hypothetical protein U5K74_14975 [Gemmatimonadaceae bacterium]|nr:hypothetical protein [Gemmatimonadaceae bacterium]
MLEYNTADAAHSAQHGVELLMHEVVAPAVQLVGGGGRTIGKREKGAIERVGVRNRPQDTRCLDQFLGARPVKDPIDIVVVIVHEQQSAAITVLLQHGTLSRREAHRQVTREEGERVAQQRLGRQRDDRTRWRHVDARVPCHRIDDIRSQQRR